MENIVFIELQRRKKEVYYHKKSKECDFVIKEGLKIKEAIQVCFDLNEECKEREIKGLAEAMQEYNLREGTLINYDKEEELKIGNKKIDVMPLWKWLLD